MVKNVQESKNMKCKAIYFYAAICFLAVLGMVLSFVLTGGRTEQPKFTPPPFEETAQSGMPDVADESWTQIYKDGMNFSTHVCGKVVLNGNSADVYLTNDEGNKVWLKLRILDEEDNILAETGLLKPNEYVKTVTFDKIPKSGANIKLKIMAYEPDTYYSAGAVTLNTTVGG